MSYREVMDMPLRAFWTFNSNVSRLSAERDMRTIQVMAGAQSSEGFAELMGALRVEMAQPLTVIDNTRSAQATAELRAALDGG